jgi:hypothetical protein
MIDIEVFLHVILSNFDVFAARGVPPDLPGHIKEKVKNIKTRIFNKVDFPLIFLPLWEYFGEPSGRYFGNLPSTFPQKADPGTHLSVFFEVPFLR